MIIRGFIAVSVITVQKSPYWVVCVDESTSYCIVSCSLSSLGGRQTFAESVHAGSDRVDDLWKGETGQGESYPARSI